nr:type VI secretion system baseplate subunit TssF [Chitinimonas arctica]
MNPTLLKYYSQELQHLREMGGEFAEAFPKVAARLGLERFECADPYVERLLEGFSFLTARVQMKLDAQFPRFTQHLTELVYPHYLTPTPSMAVVQLQPDLSNPALGDGVAVPRGTAMHSLLDKVGSTRCEYRSAHAMTLWPLSLVSASYFSFGGAIGGVDAELPPNLKAGIRLRLRVGGGLAANQLKLDTLQLHLRGSEGIPERLYEQLLAHVAAVLVLPTQRPVDWHARLPDDALRPVGFDEDEALLPPSRQSFQGYRLLQEYFAFPQRFLFVELAGLNTALRRCEESEFELLLLLDRHDPQLEQGLNGSHFALHCTPAINLFPRRADRIAISDEQFEYQVLADRTRPLDFEVYRVESVSGYQAGNATPQPFLPFHCARDHRPGSAEAFYQLRREPRLPAETPRRQGARSSYLGSELFIALVDAAEAPGQGELRQLGLELLCTNRDLPLQMPVGVGAADFTLETELPVTALRCLAGPSQPRPALADGAISWRLLNHLSLNYLSLLESDPQAGARTLRELLGLYCLPHDMAAQRQIDGLRSIASRPVTRHLPSKGPISFGRGVELTITFDDDAFEGAGPFCWGRYCSVSSPSMYRSIALPKPW